MAKSKFVFTPIKRSHLIQGSGVGSLVRLRTGVTALILDLQSWHDTIPTGKAGGFNKDAERTKRLRRHRLRDPELEAATGAPFFVEPPPGPSDNVDTRNDWVLPAVRFPLWAACANQKCGRITRAKPDQQLELRGAKRGCTCGGDNPRSRKPFLQVPIMLVCKVGHIDEIDWVAAAHNYQPVCASPDVRVKFSSSIKRPRVVCESCKSTLDHSLHASLTCTGARPWTGLPNDICNEKMHVVERTNVSVYFASVKSSIYIPDKDAENELLTEWLCTLDLSLVLDGPTDMAGLERIRARARTYGFGEDVTVEVVAAHVARLMQDAESEAPVWDELEARARELDTLSGPVPDGGHVSRLLRFKTASNIQLSRFCQSGGIFSDVVALERLTETRVLDGFGRWTPVEGMDQVRSHTLMWGGRPISKSDRWLPGFRVTGEGILFVLSDTAISHWERRSGAPVVRQQHSDPLQLSVAGVAAHTIAHSVMRCISDRCGYPLPGIRDRIYDLPDGRIALLVYTADGDTFGTLGGLVEHAHGARLSALLDDSFEAIRWCTQDPVCNDDLTDGELRTPGACHHCLLVPETSCERFNKGLDRGLIIGAASRGLVGLLG